MRRVSWPSLRQSAVLALPLLLAVPAAAQEDELPPVAEWGTAAVPFAVAPHGPSDSSLTVLVDRHDCGRRLAQSPPSATLSLTETTSTVAIRVDVRTDPGGRTCQNDRLLRLEANLSAPLGERPIVDGSRFAVAPVNRVDPPDLGLRYACGFGQEWPLTYQELLGPGLDIDGRAIPTTLSDARAIVDEGDLVILRGPFSPGGRVRLEYWRLRGDTWKRQKRGCHLMATSPPNLDTASWALGGVKPDRASKNLDVKVQEWACASGNPPVGRVVAPWQWYRPDAAYLLFHTFPITASWEANERIRARESAAASGTAAVDCQGAPPAPYRVKLWRKLGERTLYDAAWFPPKPIKERDG